MRLVVFADGIWRAEGWRVNTLAVQARARERHGRISSFQSLLDDETRRQRPSRHRQHLRGEDLHVREVFSSLVHANPLDAWQYIDNSRYMESEDAVLALAALAQPTRLDVFRLLVRHEPKGMAAGEIARSLAVPQNTMSSHLSVLSRAGLISAERFSRSIVYRVELSRFREVMLFMLRDCCDGRPEICAPLVEDLAPCCQPSAKKRGHVRI